MKIKGNVSRLLRQTFDVVARRLPSLLQPEDATNPLYLEQSKFRPFAISSIKGEAKYLHLRKLEFFLTSVQIPQTHLLQLSFVQHCISLLPPSLGITTEQGGEVHFYQQSG